jgi:hypothetical protein
MRQKYHSYSRKRGRKPGSKRMPWPSPWLISVWGLLPCLGYRLSCEAVEAAAVYFADRPNP